MAKLMTLKDIQAECGVSYNGAMRIGRESGAEVPRPIRGKHYYSREKIEQFVREGGRR